ncbi:MAG: DUF3592 domain-containing protein [Pseudolysinimonas sp.]
MSAGIIVGAIGVLILVVGVISGLRTRSFLGAAATAQGRVVEFVKHTSEGSESGSSTHAVVEFAAENGATVKFTEKSQTMGGLAVGSEVPVKYDPAAPEKARISTGGRLWLTTIVLVAVGAVMAIVGVVMGLSGS